MTNTIVDPGDIEEENGLDNYDESNAFSDLTSLQEPEHKGMSFHVEMRGYTMADFDEMVVRTAAQLLLDAGPRDEKLKKQVQDRAMQMIEERIDKCLEGITAEIVNQPVMHGKEPVSMAEFMGLAGREYLQQKVNNRGETGSGFGFRSVGPRIQYIAQSAIEKAFDRQMKAELAGMTKELQSQIKQGVQAAVDAEKEKFRKVLEMEVRTAK